MSKIDVVEQVYFSFLLLMPIKYYDNSRKSVYTIVREILLWY